MAKALIALGSNQGDRQTQMGKAMDEIARVPGVRVFATSTPVVTRPIGGPADQGEFLNAAALLEVTLEPRELLALLHEVETRLGRKRDERWAERTIDLDLLLYDELVLDEADIVLPHPRMSYRRFVMAPAAAIAPSMIVPTIGATLGELMAALDERPPLVAIAVPPDDVANATLAKELAGEIGAQGCFARWAVGDPIVHNEATARLVVVLDSSLAPDDWREGLRHSIRSLHKGPLLWLRDANAEDAKVEAIAASQAVTGEDER